MFHSVRRRSRRHVVRHAQHEAASMRTVFVGYWLVIIAGLVAFLAIGLVGLR
jgi:hypothetical protein